MWFRFDKDVPFYNRGEVLCLSSLITSAAQSRGHEQKLALAEMVGTTSGRSKDNQETRSPDIQREQRARLSECLQARCQWDSEAFEASEVYNIPEWIRDMDDGTKEISQDNRSKRITIERYHDISAGHRVYGHENKCSALHGHNYRITFTVACEKLDHLGRVLDFGVVNALLCQWLEDNWDHRFIMWGKDPLVFKLNEIDPGSVWVSNFNPTAENMAEYLVTIIGPQVLLPEVKLVKVKVEETRKCSAIYELPT